MRRIAKKRKASFETSSSVSRASSSRDARPGERKAAETLARERAHATPRSGQLALEPAHVKALGGAGADDHEALRREPRDREVAHQPPQTGSASASAPCGPARAGGRPEAGPARPRRPGRRPRTWRSWRSRAGPRPRAPRGIRRPTGVVRVRAPEGRRLVRLAALGREPQRMLEAEAGAEHRVPWPSADRRPASCAAAAPPAAPRWER